MKMSKDNILMLIALFIMAVLFILFFTPLVEFRDSTYRIANSFAENNPTEKTIEECISELGEPIYIDEQMACFSGGHTCRFGYICERKEYDLVVIYDENKHIMEVYHVCKLYLRKGLSSVLDLAY